MTGWRVDPAALNRILIDTSAAVQAAGTALEGVIESPADVQASAGFDGVVASAYVGFLQEVFDGQVTSMFARYQAALEGTTNAANTYLAGDEEMAATIAAAIATSDFGSALFGSSTGDGGEG